MQNKIDGDIPSAPPLNGSSYINQVSEKLRNSRADAKPSLRTSGGSSTKVESNMTAEASVRYVIGNFQTIQLSSFNS